MKFTKVIRDNNNYSYINLVTDYKLNIKPADENNIQEVKIGDYIWAITIYKSAFNYNRIIISVQKVTYEQDTKDMYFVMQDKDEKIHLAPIMDITISNLDLYQEIKKYLGTNNELLELIKKYI